MYNKSMNELQQCGTTLALFEESRTIVCCSLSDSLMKM